MLSQKILKHWPEGGERNVFEIYGSENVCHRGKENGKSHEIYKIKKSSRKISNENPAISTLINENNVKVR